MLNKIKATAFILITCIFIITSNLFSQTNDDCFACHDDHSLTKVKQGKTISLFVDKNKVGNSVHKNVLCAACHKDAAVSEFPHPENLKPVDCGTCHKVAQMQFFTGIHGQALKLNAPYAPDCKECHGDHEILHHTNPKSLTYKMNIPILCGKCHKEGSPVQRIYNITEHNILEHYSESIHGKGLFKSGLIVTATCNDCHGNHLILPGSSPNSSVSSNKIAKTCMKCHARIEQVHTKVVKRELWEKQAGTVPACSDCHPSHIVKIKKIEETIENQICLKCHESDNTFKMVNNVKKSLKIDKTDLINSAHKKIPCTKCHTDITLSNKTERPCSTNKKVDCSICHQQESNLYINSGHGQAFFNKKGDAPYCTDCHGTHKIKTRYDDTSPTYRGSIPELCGKCHKKDGRAVKHAHLKEIDAFNDYSSSVHGKGLNEKGLLASAVCTDCHTSHNILKESDENSTINPKNVPTTCAKCHKGIYDDYISSDHAVSNNSNGKKFPSCADCHTAHTITEIDKDKFLTQITVQCGSCHKKLSKTYMETYHGKAYTLGYLKAARCSDCHGAHKILNISNPESSVGVKNIVATCKKCHENANTEFTGYLTHATHNDNKVLYYTFWFMTSLLLGVFGFFGLHTLLWIPRSIKEAIRKKKHHKQVSGEATYFRRFKRSQRVTHIFVILSFLLLALTGMMLKFAHMTWALNLSKLIGGVHNAGNFHRFAAIITFGYFLFHIISLIREKIKLKISFMKFAFGPNSIMFNKRDIKDFIATVKWFLGKGPRPNYGRWTYWEKFDYLAVFWGVAIIGFSGLILWMPEYFTKIFPGWLINVAQIIHSDEALLAVGFIFTIHFFNTHLRPEAFPMDTVIFTGHVEIDEYKADRPREYEELEQAGKLDTVVVNREISKPWIKFVKACGYVFLSLGIILVILIIYSMLTGHY